MGIRFKGKDWCSYFPDNIWGKYVGDICYQHDMRYSDHSKSRWTADLEFFNDLKHRGLPITGALMWLGVRLVGWSFYRR